MFHHFPSVITIQNDQNFSCYSAEPPKALENFYAHFKEYQDSALPKCNLPNALAALEDQRQGPRVGQNGRTIRAFWAVGLGLKSCSKRRRKSGRLIAKSIFDEEGKEPWRLSTSCQSVFDSGFGIQALYK